MTDGSNNFRKENLKLRGKYSRTKVRGKKLVRVSNRKSSEKMTFLGPLGSYHQIGGHDGHLEQAVNFLVLCKFMLPLLII